MSTERWMALTLRQPWLWAILSAGKRIENRTWKTAARGPVLLHAATGCTMSEYEAAIAWMDERKLIRRRSAPLTRENASLPVPPRLDQMTRGAFCGIAKIADMIAPGVVMASNAEAMQLPLGQWNEDNDRLNATHPRLERRWHMIEQFGFVLDHVRELPTKAASGSLGLFTVPPDVLTFYRLPAKPSEWTP